MDTRTIRQVRACETRTLTVGQDLGLIGGTEANIMEDEKRHVRAAPEPALAHLRQPVQAAAQPQDRLLPVLSQRHAQEQLQPQNAQPPELSAPSFGQRQGQEALQEVTLWRHGTLFPS